MTMDFSDEYIWRMARDHGLLTRQPGSKGFDDALFSFARDLVKKSKSLANAGDLLEKTMVPVGGNCDK